MINYTGIAGGIGPTGSVKSKNKNVEIPRSKKAQNIHAIAFVIKLIFFLAILVILGMGLINFTNTYQNILFSILFLLIGGGIVQLLYQITKVKSKLFHSRVSESMENIIKAWDLKPEETENKKIWFSYRWIIQFFY